MGEAISEEHFQELGGSSEYDLIKKLLGIGAKGSIRDDNDLTTRQPERKEHSKPTYYPWFDELMEDLTKGHENPGYYSKDLAAQESLSAHPMDVNTHRCFEKIVLFLRNMDWSLQQQSDQFIFKAWRILFGG